jgi:single-stranded-DNA-specific exonuclease
VPLRGENRRLVREGLEAMARTRRPGLRALMKISQLDPGDVDARALAFRLAPRINAAGRLQRADAGLELLLTEDAERAAQVADELDLLNRERQDTETRIMFAAETERARHDGEAAYVLAGEGWHAGVIGIVASRIVERHHRPTLLIALDGDSGRGSGRSIGPFDLHAGLAACSDLLVRFGGHRAAAGFEVSAENVDGLRRAFVHHAASTLTPRDLIPEERVDALVPGTSLGLDLAEELRRLEPFGMGNPEPTLLVPAARLGDARSMGDEGQHCRFTLSSGGVRARGVAFRTAAGSISGCAEEPFDVALRLELNRWNGTVEPRVVLRALCAVEPGEPELVGPERDFWTDFEAGLSDDPEPTRLPSAAVRQVLDRRGEGFAGVTGQLVSSGEPVLIVCADIARRREGLGRVLGERVPALVSWASLAADPSAASAFTHVVALDPGLTEAGEELLAALPGTGFAHLAWDEPEVAFVLALAQAELDLRPPLIAVYRALRDVSGASGEEFRALLAGDGRYPRSAALCARLVRVLVELGLARYSERSCTLVSGVRADLEAAPTYQRCQQQLGAARAYLAAAMPARRRAAA